MIIDLLALYYSNICEPVGSSNYPPTLTTGCHSQRVANGSISSALTDDFSSLVAFCLDIDPCDELQASANATFSGFSRTDTVHCASVSSNRLRWIMSSFFLRVEKLQYGTSKHYA